METQKLTDFLFTAIAVTGQFRITTKLNGATLMGLSGGRFPTVEILFQSNGKSLSLNLQAKDVMSSAIKIAILTKDESRFKLEFPLQGVFNPDLLKEFWRFMETESGKIFNTESTKVLRIVFDYYPGFTEVGNFFAAVVDSED